MNVYKAEPAPDYIPDKLETGTQNHEGIAGVKGAIDFISSLDDGASLRDRLVGGMRAIEDYEALLAERFRTALREIPGVKLYAAPDDVRKTPTIAFRLENRTPREFCGHIAEEGYFLAKGGWIRAGLAPYNTEEEVEGFIEAPSLAERYPSSPRIGRRTKDVGSEHDKYFAEE